VLKQLYPTDQGHELATTIGSLPRGSKITDVAFSTATNVIYMQVLIPGTPARYQVYRTDANHNLTRTYLTTTRTNRIGTLYDQDILVYDDLEKDTVIARKGDGSWAVISPTVGKYRFIGIDSKSYVQIARLNKDGLADVVLKGTVKGGFIPVRTLQPPLDVGLLQVSSRE
jgi:hypothetical protein